MKTFLEGVSSLYHRYEEAFLIKHEYNTCIAHVQNMNSCAFKKCSQCFLPMIFSISFSQETSKPSGFCNFNHGQRRLWYSTNFCLSSLALHTQPLSKEFRRCGLGEKCLSCKDQVCEGPEHPSKSKGIAWRNY